MFIKYGALDFEIERIYRWDHRAVFDETGQDYLYDHIVIGVQCVLNTAATRSDAVMRRPVQGNRGTYAAASVRDLRTYMMQPRLPLQVRIGPEFILESPPRKPGKIIPSIFPCDAKGGPQPLAFNVINNYGAGRTIIATFEVETWINDFINKDKTPAILSNRWTMTHDIDEFHYTTRTIQGRAVFRKDLLVGPINVVPADAAAGSPAAYPDDFRAKLFHPIPNNYKRVSVNVTQPGDGTILDYRITDVEQPVNLGRDNPIVKMKGNIQSGWDGRGRFFAFASWYVKMTIEVWGRRSTSREQLIKACARALASLGFNGADNAGGFFGQARLWHCNWNVDLFDRYASCTMGVAASGATEGARVWTGNAFNTRWRNDIIADFPEQLDGVTTNADAPNPPPPNGDGSVGTSLVRMVTQILSSPATVPVRPPAPEERRFSKLYGTGGY